jgi:AraC family transcriptional regulator, regulatory protein of adaptative response / methylated-DNA-[protein]-cysteine methyltransferase
LHYVTFECPIGLLAVGSRDGLIVEARFIEKSERVTLGAPHLLEEWQLEAMSFGWYAPLRAYLAKGIHLPRAALALAGTDFQRKVWTALEEIPAGTTVSYSQLAVRIGNPAAVRAVASACAANEIALFIPCHRVIRGNGQFGEYRWGAARKAALLALESRF